MSYWEPIRYVQSFPYEQQWRQQPAAMLHVPLERTSEPVWPEDEAAELAQPDATPIPFMTDQEADKVLENITVELPDRLIPILAQGLDLHKSAGLPMGRPAESLTGKLTGILPGPLASSCDHVAFHIPTSYSAPESLILRRLRLDLFLSGEDAMVPIAIFMQPGTEVDVSVQKIGDIGVDLGALVSALAPQLPPIFTASLGTKLERETVHPKVQASGLQRHNCSWRVADSQIAYDFNPALIAQFAQTLMVSASLHIEVHKSVLGVFHKTYGTSATPMSYMYRSGQALMTAFDYLEHFKELKADTDLYQNRIAGSQAFYRLAQKHEGQDAAMAKIWYKRAADAGNVAAMMRLAERAEERDQTAEAEKWYQRAAAAGHTDAMIRLGNLTQQRDQTEAEMWYQMAAKAGGAPIMSRLGRQFEERDQAEEAEKWYTRAADAGDRVVMVRMGRLAEEARDRTKAEKWYRRAADAGETAAMVRMGELAEEARDRTAASFWYRKAADAGNYKARKALKRIHPWKNFFMRYRHL
jgi:TPR repeat protein